MYSSNTVAAMNNLNYVKAILLFYPVAFVIIRSNISGILDYQLNRSALKKRKKDETVKEWLLYSRFREEIPKAILVLYFVILAVHPAAMLVCYVVHCTKASVGISTGAAYFILFFNAAWTSVLSLLFRPGKDKRIRYERWIKRRRGQTCSSSVRRSGSITRCKL